MAFPMAIGSPGSAGSPPPPGRGPAHGRHVGSAAGEVGAGLPIRGLRLGHHAAHAGGMGMLGWGMEQWGDHW